MFKGEIIDGGNEMFIVYKGKDERDPHGFIMMDPFYQNGLVKSWTIKELDLAHSDRDDEIVLS